METSKTIGDFISGLPRPGVLCTLVKIVGSAPQEAGARMWVTADQFFGTLGGGEFEFQVLKHSRELLRDSAVRPHLKEYVLCKEMGQCCGGRVEVFFELVSKRKEVHLFGGGHVGRAAAHVLSGMPFEVHLIDERPKWGSPDGLPRDIQVHNTAPAEYASSRTWSENDAVCIFTHSHDLDYKLVRCFLMQPVGYLGLIGSDHKARVFLVRLQSERKGSNGEVEELWEEKMHCPIGLPLDSKNPKIIAVAIVVELLQKWGLIRNQSSDFMEEKFADFRQAAGVSFGGRGG